MKPNTLFTVSNERMSISINIPQESTRLDEVVVHKTTPRKERKKASLELLAKHPEVFETGVLQMEVDMPNLTSTEADIIIEGAKQFHLWKHFLTFIFQIYPHNNIQQNIHKAEILWQYVLLMQGRDTDIE